MAQEPGRITNESESDRASSLDREIFDAAGGDETELEEGERSAVDEDTEQIRQDIDETRSELGDTIDAIQERLSFSNISEQVSEQVTSALETAKDSVYDATIGKVMTFMKQAGTEIRSTSIGRTVMDNPLPFALIGAGAAMLVYSNWGKTGRRSTARYAGYTSGRSLASGSGSGVSDTASGASETLSSAADRVSDVANSAMETVSTTASSALDKVSSAATETYRGAANMANTARRKVGELGNAAQESYEHYVDERPLAVAAAAAAVGAAIGLALPSTRYEAELMGETRENLVNKVEGMANELVDKAKQAANEAGKSISQEVNSRGGQQPRA